MLPLSKSNTNYNNDYHIFLIVEGVVLTQIIHRFTLLEVRKPVNKVSAKFLFRGNCGPFLRSENCEHCFI